jgi:uncharacterized protein
MQDITPQISKTKKLIESYGNGGFRVTGERYEGNIMIMPDSVHVFPALDIEGTTPQDLKPVIENEIEILIVGGGRSAGFFDKDIENLLHNEKIGIEYMDTGAAARTYNVLLTEERKVAVVLIAV